MGISMPKGGAKYNDEPNVVPMIDVLLVLLIIFMMQIPLSRQIMDINLPPEQEVDQEQLEQSESNQIVMELREDGAYAINSEVIPFSQLSNKLHEVYDNRPVKLLFIKTARNRIYSEVVMAMDLARSAGVQVIGFTPPAKADADAGAEPGA